MKTITVVGNPSETTVNLTKQTGPRAASGRHAELLVDLQNAAVRLTKLVERSRQRRRVQLFQLEAGAREYDLAVKFAGLREDQIDNKVAVNTALGRLLRKALFALLHESKRRR